MKKQFNLSEKVCYFNGKRHYSHKKVKEFIRRLKGVLLSNDASIKIDTLAGSKLI